MAQVSTKNNQIHINSKDKEKEEDILKNRTNKKLTAPKDKKKLRQKIDYRNYVHDSEEEEYC